MRRFSAAFFLIVFLFANTELHELTKMGAFINHYKEHRQENRDLTLIDFIIIHYFSGNIVDADYAQDMQLPFKTVDCSNSIPTVTLPLPEFFDFNPSVLIKSRALPPYDQSVLPSSHLDDIWQPPKTC